MCGRYALGAFDESLESLFELVHSPADVAPTWNVAPTATVPVVLWSDKRGGRTAERFRWGLVPPWAKDVKIGARMINARMETVSTSKAFETSFAHKRCLVPARGFYEWGDPDGGGKRPFYFAPLDGPAFAMAGIWSRWRDANGRPLHSFSIITRPASDLVAEVHDRVAAVLPEMKWAEWLDVGNGDSDRLLDMLRREGELAAGAYVRREVSTRVNNARNDGPDLIAGL